MELGSNAAVVVHKDADIKKAAIACALRSFYNAGQVCISVQRVLVHKDAYTQFIAEAKSAAEALVLGNPMDAATTMGPMISDKEVQRIDRWVKEAVQAGAKIVTGGSPAG
jgi:acyl-CoA reductase-like NAD-dependent aldehyde dehydrogenase